MKHRQSHFPRRLPPSAAGFTFLEILVVLAVILVVAALTISNFGMTMKRVKLQGDATAIANSIQRARSIAVRRSKAVVVEIDSALELAFFFDEDGNLRYDAGTDELAMPSLGLSKGRQPASSVRFWSPIGGDVSPNSNNAMDGFTSRTDVSLPPALVIESDGSVRDLGGIRIGMAGDPISSLSDGNFMEVRVVTAATGRTELRKLIPGQNPPYETKKKTADGTNWKFY